jgi:hypothetical protein
VESSSAAMRQPYHDWMQTCECGEAVQCVDCGAAWVVRHGPEPPHLPMSEIIAAIQSRSHDATD